MMCWRLGSRWSCNGERGDDVDSGQDGVSSNFPVGNRLRGGMSQARGNKESLQVRDDGDMILGAPRSLVWAGGPSIWIKMINTVEELAKADHSSVSDGRRLAWGNCRPYKNLFSLTTEPPTLVIRICNCYERRASWKPLMDSFSFGIGKNLL